MVQFTLATDNLNNKYNSKYEYYEWINNINNNFVEEDPSSKNEPWRELAKDYILSNRIAIMKHRKEVGGNFTVEQMRELQNICQVPRRLWLNYILTNIDNWLLDSEHDSIYVTQQNCKIYQNNRDGSNNKRTPTKYQQNLDKLIPDDENKVKKDKISRLFSCQKKKQFTKPKTNSIEFINIRANVKMKVKSFSSSITSFSNDLQSRKYSSDEENEDETNTRAAIALTKTPPRLYLQDRANKDEKHTTEDKQQFSEQNNKTYFNKIKVRENEFNQQKYTTTESISDLQLSIDTQIKVRVSNDDEKNSFDDENYKQKYTNKFSSESKDSQLISKPKDILHYLCLAENPNYCEKCKELKQIFEKKSSQSPPFLHNVPMGHFAQQFMSRVISKISIAQVILDNPSNKIICDFMNENVHAGKFRYDVRDEIEDFIMKKAQAMYPWGGHIFFSVFKTKFLEKDLAFFFEHNIISNESQILMHEEIDGMTFINRYDEMYQNIFLFDELVNELRLEEE